MKLAFYEPLPIWNPYVSLMFFTPLIQYCHQNGIPVKRIQEPVPEFGWTMVCNAYHLTAELVAHFDNNRCPIVAFSCNDSAYLTANIQDFFHHIPLLFTISGVQKVNYSNRSVMNADMSVSLEPVQFLPDEEWNRYDHMRQSGRLLPLPYVPWDRLPDVHIPEQKTPKILFRGGCHFWRFVAYLHAVKAGVAHPASGFLLRDYFDEKMVPQFRFCEKCRADYLEGGKWMSNSSLYTQCECSPHQAQYEGDVYVNKEEMEQPLSWNNRTPRGFFSLAHTFCVKNDGCIPQADVEMALNFQRQSADHHLRAIADAAFFCDMKWEFSIHTAQRFWEAASVGTVNVLPHRAVDQDYFPHLLPDYHYAWFRDDFTGFGTPEWMANNTAIVAGNAKALYEQWIKPSDYVTNTNLLKLILQEIERVAG